MRISRFDNGFLRLGLLAVLATAGLWFNSKPVETAQRAIGLPERPPMFVLQVGIGKYLHSPTWATLRGAVNDVVEMRKVLESDRYNVPPANILTLTDEQGTKAKIFEAFQTHLIANARDHFEKTKRRDAVVMFEFSGHGSQVPDVDGDEKDDHLDETLVTYDSEDAPGKNFDVTDDEIFALTSELRRYTDNIVYVFDSCHSGSGTRDAEDVRRLPERRTVPVSVGGVGTTTRSGPAKAEDDPDTGVLPPGDDYIVITAARSGQLASQRNCFEECGQTKTPVVFGNLTFYLVDELKQARSDTSYRELMENVTRRVVAEKPTQTPQLEGDKSRFVFGARGSKEDNFTKIVEPESRTSNGTRTIKIRTGAMQGVTPGTIVSFYDKGVSRFDDAEKIAGGSVMSVTPMESTVRLFSPQRELTIADKAVVISPDLGSLRLKVNLDVDAATFSPGQKNVVAAVKADLTGGTSSDIEARGVDVAVGTTAAAGRWDVAVLKDKFANVVSKSPGGLEGCDSKSAGTEIFYLAGRDYVPLYRFCLEATFADEASQKAAANRINDALVHIAKLRSIIALSNKRSALKGKVSVRVMRLIGTFGCSESKFTATEMRSAVADAKSGNYLFKPGDVFWFEITNNSASDLYLALLDIPPDGSVKVFSPSARYEGMDGVIVPRNGGKRILMSEDCRVGSDGNILEAGAFRVSSLPGLDRFKLIASTQKTTRENFGYLEMPALAQPRRTGTSLLADTGDWTTVETILQINDTGN